MESYNWKRLNPKVRCVGIKKKFFNQYFYSMTYYCPGGRIILQPGNTTLESILNAITIRREHERSFQSRLYTPWYNLVERNFVQDKEKILAQQLLDVFTVKTKYKPNIKVRIEEPYVTIYAELEETLLKIATQDLIYWTDRLEYMHGPETNEIKAILNNNVVLIKKDIGFKYKFICKEGRYQNKATLYSYLDQLGDEIQISKTNWTRLEANNSYVRNLWIYANDSNIASMLNLIEPTVVRNIHELVIAPTK